MKNARRLRAATFAGRRPERRRARRIATLLDALRRHRHDREVVTAAVFFALACLGWAISAVALAIAGMLGAFTTVAMWLWQRHCLTAVRYRRSLSEPRANFGERVVLELELVNDKLLPLSWLQVEDTVPAGLPIDGATVQARGRGPRSDTLVQIRPLLPYQRVRRRFVLHCARRGEHAFGPGQLTSGDPIGLRQRSETAPGEQHLIVYPKVFALAPASVVSRVLVGEQRTRRELLEDPSRAAGVREYRPGDPLRRVHWRASARSSNLLVREFEPTVSLRVALFLDLAVPGGRPWAGYSPKVEFTVAVAASLLAELDRLGVPTGLYGAGTIGGYPLVLPASGVTAGLAGLLEALAKVQDRPAVSFSGLITAQSRHLQHGTSVIAVANDFSGSSMESLCELRRRHAVTACFVDSGEGLPPLPGMLDAVVRARYEEDWEEREILELAA
jgi:uncharacterized protein (DUF58 family)